MKQHKRINVKAVLSKISNRPKKSSPNDNPEKAEENDNPVRRADKAKAVKDAANAILNDVSAISMSNRNTKDSNPKSNRKEEGEERKGKGKVHNKKHNHKTTEEEEAVEEEEDESDSLSSSRKRIKELMRGKGIKSEESLEDEDVDTDEDEENGESGMEEDDETGAMKREKRKTEREREAKEEESAERESGQEPPGAGKARNPREMRVQKLDGGFFVHTEKALHDAQKELDKIYKRMPSNRKSTGKEILNYLDKLQYVTLARAERLLADARMLVSPSELIKLAQAIKDMQLTIKWTKKLESVILNNPSKILPVGSGKGWTLLGKLKEMSSAAKRESKDDRRMSGIKRNNDSVIPLPQDEDIQKIAGA